MWQVPPRQSTRPPVGVGPERNEDRRTERYRQAKETKCGEKGVGKSERSIVPRKPGNSARGNPMEGRERRGEESLEGNMASASKLGPVSTRRQRIAELAKQSPQMGFTSL